jgi:hypothetical protein
MKKIIILLIITFICLSFSQVNESEEPDDNGQLICSDKAQIYGYKSVMQYTNKKENQKSSNTITLAKVENTCIKETEKGDYFYHIRILSINITVKGESQKIKSSDFADFSSYVMSPNGKLKKFWTTAREASEAPYVTAIKKGIVANFQTKLNGKQRLQHTQEGDIIVHYEQRILDDGSLLIEALKKHKDLIKTADKHQRRRDSHTKSKKFNIIKKGIQVKVTQETDDKVGKHKKTVMEKTIKTSKGEQADVKSDDMFSMESRSELFLIKQVPKMKKHKNDATVLSLLNHEGDIEEKLGEMEGLEEQDLGLDKRVIKRTNQHHKRKMKQEVDFPKTLGDILQSIKEGKVDMNLIGLAEDYSKNAKKNAYKVLSKQFTQLYVKEKLTKVEREYSKVLLTLLSAVDSREAQLLMLQGFSHKSLRFNVNVALLALRKPIREIVDTLKRESRNAKKPKEERENSHLTLAAIAQNVDKDTQDEIVAHLLEVMGSDSQNYDDLEFHLHALSNAGEAVPLEVYSQILNSPIHLHGKVIIANSLSNRVSEEGDEETTAFVHSVLSSDVDEAVKIAAVKAQINREHVLQNSGSVLEFKQYLDSPETSTVLSKVLRAYYEEADIHPSEMETETLESKVLFWRRLRRAFRRVGGFIRRAVSAVRNVVKKVVKTVVKVAKTVVKGVVSAIKKIAEIAGSVGKFFKNLKAQFGKAEFEGKQVCMAANNKGDNICMHDDEMVAFIRSQGDLSTMKWSRHFTFERLIGAKVLHMYIGAVGYGGTAIDCENNTLDAVFFARVDFWAKIFNRKLNVLSMSIELSKRPDQDLKDRAYVKLGPAVLVNRQFVPDKIRQFINSCEEGSKPLVRKTFDKLAQFQFTIVIVVVPVRFGFVLSADMGIDLVFTICPSKLTLNVGVEPWFTLSIRAEAGISIFIAHGGVSVTASFNYRLKPNIGTANCNICAIISQTIIPITIKVEGYASAFGKRWAFKIYEWASKPINQELFRKCLKSGPYNPAVSGNQNQVEQPAQPEQPAQQTEQPTQPEQPAQTSQTVQTVQTAQPTQTVQTVQTQTSAGKPQIVSSQTQPNFVNQQNMVQQTMIAQQNIAQQNMAQQNMMFQQYTQWVYQQQLAQWYQQEGCGCEGCCC